jgi:hypothetical protein
MTIKALYPTVRPTLNLNFARTKALDPRVTFSRASTGTFVGSNGLIQTAASGAARFDHNPETGESLGLLVEEARTNLYPISETYASWNVDNNATQITDGTTIAGLTAVKLTSNVDTNALFLEGNNATFTPNTTYTSSVYHKPGNVDGFWFEARGYIGGGTPKLYFNSSTETWSATSGGTAPATWSVKSEKVESNAWRHSITFYIATDTAGTLRLGGLAPANTENVLTGDFGYLAAPQIETGSFPTSYIPTTGSTVTRAADVATLANTGSSIFPVSAFTTVNSPFGTAGGGTTVKLVGPTVKRTAVYNGDLPQAQINTLAGVNDDFWRWRVLGSSFALPGFFTDGQVTVDWGDGTIETLTTAEHTFSNGGGYHDIGFRLDSGTYFKLYINNNASHATKVVALGPAPESMKLNGDRAFWGCSNLEAFDATVDATGSFSFSYAWNNCTSLTSFPLINTAAGTNFTNAWNNCPSLTSFPLINTAAGTVFQNTWLNCSGLTSFPPINTESGTNFLQAWYGCSSLTSFPLIDTAAGTNFQSAWLGLSALTSFPLINTAAGTNFSQAWKGCNSLTSFPLINTAAGTNFSQAWQNCTSLTSFPLINTAAGTNFTYAWYGCNSLTSFPLINTAAVTNFGAAWYNCSSLTSFPLINTAAGTGFNNAWTGCSSLTSFPLIDTAAGTNFGAAWYNCSSLTSFPLINTAAGTNFQSTWEGCTNLTSFPLINTGAGTNFSRAWLSCTNLSSFPLINTAAGTNFFAAWQGLSALTSFPLVDTSAGTNFLQAWNGCSGLTSFPLINTAAGTNFQSAWIGCSSLTSFPLINTGAGTNFQSAWENCTNLASFPLINTGAGTNFSRAWLSCTNLSSFPANMFNTTGTLVATAFTSAFQNCALTAASIENILTSLVTNGQSNITLTLSGGTNAGASTWTANAVTAYNTLISRGWTISRNA